MSETRELFRRLFLSRGKAAKPLREQLLKTRDAQGILKVSLEDFEAKGNADRLTLAESLLHDLEAEPELSVVRSVLDR